MLILKHEKIMSPEYWIYEKESMEMQELKKIQ